MQRLTRARWPGLLCLSIAMLAGMATIAQAAEPPALPPLRDFFRTPLLAGPVLSPSGRFLAGGVSADGGRVRLAILDLENLGKNQIVAEFQDADVASIAWVNEKRLVFSARSSRSGTDKDIAPGLWAVNQDGSEFRQLIKAGDDPVSNRPSHLKDRLLPWNWELHTVLEDGSDDVLVRGWNFDIDYIELRNINLARLNTRTSQQTNLVEGAPDHIFNWVTDSQGKVVAASGWHGQTSFSYLRAADGGWQQWQSSPAYGDGKAETLPYWASDQGMLLALAPSGEGTAALFELDRTTLKLKPEPVISLAGYDFNGEIVYDAASRRLIGLYFENDAQGSVWFDPLMRTTQAEVDKLLPASNNRLACRRCLTAPKYLVKAMSDRQPIQYFVYDRTSKQLINIAGSRPWIQPAQMGMRDMHRFAARDGLSIPVLITQPPGPVKPRPAVVLVHGGPWLRGAHWEWQVEAQLLASRGYVVIEPEFRGSTGYGFAHFRAGWKQWGLGMQDDLADAVQWAAGKGFIDPTRVCIAGASYGGYAVLMGLIKHAELYQCGINWIGVSDVNLMYSISWSDLSADWKRYGMPVLIGDPVKDALQLSQTSPLEQAAKLRRPLLLAYGEQDRRVPSKHGKAFRDAVSRSNKDVEYISYAEEGHGWYLLETNEDFWGRALRLLDRSIGASSPK